MCKTFVMINLILISSAKARYMTTGVLSARGLVVIQPTGINRKRNIMVPVITEVTETIYAIGMVVNRTNRLGSASITLIRPSKLHKCSFY